MNDGNTHTFHLLVGASLLPNVKTTDDRKESLVIKKFYLVFIFRSYINSVNCVSDESTNPLS